VREEIVHPRLQSGAATRPLNFTVREMPTTMSLRIPAWLAGSTGALLIAATVRVAEARGFAGIVELTQTVALIGLCTCALVVAEQIEAHPLANILIWPSRKFRRILFLGLIAVVDCYFMMIFVLGGTFAGTVGI
jgi:hypothetical protein